MQEGYIKLHRCILDSSWSRQPDFIAVWVYCLLRGNYKTADVVTRGGGIVHLEPGQFITSREQISIGTGVQESKVERVLKVFKSEQQIEQRNCGYYRVISILNWSKYQQNEQEFEQCLNNERTMNEQCLNTDKKVKKVKKEKKEPTVKFSPPSVLTVQEYMGEIGFDGNGEQFVNYYESKGWMVGKSKMKDWKASVRTWKTNGYGNGGQSKPQVSNAASEVKRKANEKAQQLIEAYEKENA